MLKIQAIGNLGKDAVMRKTGNDTAIAFTVAVNKKYKNAAGVEVEETTWIDCTLWRRPDQSTAIAEYLKAGSKVYVEGEPSARYYVNGSGEPVAALTLRVSTVELVSSKKPETAPATEKPKPGDLPASSFDGSDLNQPGKGGLPASDFDNEPEAAPKKKKAAATA